MGYWGREDLTQLDFHARLEGKEDHDGYLRTGDLGFMHNEELFICGRSKDLIIIRGTNHYPQDIERVAESCSPQIRPGCSAVFAVSIGNSRTEGVVLIAEVSIVINTVVRVC